MLSQIIIGCAAECINLHLNGSEKKENSNIDFSELPAIKEAAILGELSFAPRVFREYSRDKCGSDKAKC